MQVAVGGRRPVLVLEDPVAADAVRRLEAVKRHVALVQRLRGSDPGRAGTDDRDGGQRGHVVGGPLQERDRDACVTLRERPLVEKQRTRGHCRHRASATARERERALAAPAVAQLHGDHDARPAAGQRDRDRLAQPRAADRAPPAVRPHGQQRDGGSLRAPQRDADLRRADAAGGARDRHVLADRQRGRRGLAGKGVRPRQRQGRRDRRTGARHPEPHEVAVGHEQRPHALDDLGRAVLIELDLDTDRVGQLAEAVAHRPAGVDPGRAEVGRHRRLCGAQLRLAVGLRVDVQARGEHGGVGGREARRQPVDDGRARLLQIQRPGCDADDPALQRVAHPHHRELVAQRLACRRGGATGRRAGWG